MPRNEGRDSLLPFSFFLSSLLSLFLINQSVILLWFIDLILIAQNHLHFTIRIGSLKLRHFFRLLQVYLILILLILSLRRDIIRVVSHSHFHCHVVKRTSIVKRVSRNVLQLNRFCIINFLTWFQQLCCTLWTHKFKHFVTICRHLCKTN